MSDVLFVEYPKCSTCRRAKAWLDERGVSYVDRHIVEDNPSADELAAWQARSGLPVRRFFNTSGRLYRERNVKALLDAGMADADAFALLAEDGMMVKRPIVVGGGLRARGLPRGGVGGRAAVVASPGHPVSRCARITNRGPERDPDCYVGVLPAVLLVQP